MRLIVCHSTFAGRMRGFQGRWLFADSNLNECTLASSALGSRATPLLSPRELQYEIAKARTGFTEWVDANLSGNTTTSILLTPLTRNPFHELFYGTVMLRLATEGLQTGDGTLLVVTKSLGLMKALRFHSQRTNISFRCIGLLGYLLTAIKYRGRSLVKYGRDVFHMLIRAVLARVLLGNKQLDRAKGVDVLVDTYLFQGDVSASGVVNHRYFPGLLDWYLQRGFKPAYYPILFKMPIRSLPSLYRGYRTSKYVFLPLELLCRLSDIARASLLCLRGAFKFQQLSKPWLFGVNVADLVEATRFSMAMDGLIPLLMLTAPRRMERLGIRPRWMLDWFENQPVDQATMIGFRQYQPACRVIALRLYAQYSSNLLSFQVTSREVDEGLVPGTHWMGGNVWLKTASTYDSRGSYKVVPCLRYSYIHDMKPSGAEGADLLVLLTHSLPESARILESVEKLLPNLKAVFPSIKIKPHPVLNVERLRRGTMRQYPGLWSEKSVFWVDSHVSGVLATSRLVISAGTSSALEAVSMGIPIIVIGARIGIDMCPLEFVDERLWRIVFNDQELEKAINEWTPDHPMARDERLAIGKIIMNECFEPVTGDSMERFALE